MTAHTVSSRPHRRRAFLALATGALFALGLAACGSDSVKTGSGAGGTTSTAAEGGNEYGTPTSTSGATAEGSTVVAKDFSLTSISVAPGATVTFENTGKATHTMTADDGAFDTDRVSPGSKATITAPQKAGAYAFHCKIHPSMTATLTVAG